MLWLTEYNFTTRHIKGTENISDYTSRHPVDPPLKSDIYVNYINFITNHALPKALTIDEIKQETEKDELLQQLIRLIEDNSWHKLDDPRKYKLQMRKEILKDLKPFRKFKTQLTVTADWKIVLKEHKIVLLFVHQTLILKIAHQGHQGIFKTKNSSPK